MPLKGALAVQSILETCKPRGDILTGTFNPEIFTASLSAVLRHYRGQSSAIHKMYTDAEVFFGEATYPTDGIRTVLAEVFGRLGGDNSLPAIHRLETAFGGGKTHTLIACTHIGFRGKELASATKGMIDAKLLPEAGQVTVVGVAGDEIPVHQPQGAELVPYTLWGEIAYQVGSEGLYREVEPEVASYAAPGKTYFDKVFGGRQVLLMLDELAQYAARLEAARADGGEQLAAFLMGLHGYARVNPGIAVVLTLASAADAFANQTQGLTSLLSDVRGEDVSEDGALGIGQKALKSVASVVARDASPVVPVQPAEISSVLAKRLFDQVDQGAGRETVKAYAKLYRTNGALLPDEATRADYADRMAAHYPFHPTLIDFLNKKLATAEDFQGTRGVLRVLALTVRNLWGKQRKVPMIHACNLDLRDARTVSEVLGRTGGGDLLPVLNADVGGVDTTQLEGGRSNAELADLRNPHPEGHPMYEYTWKTAFLHSLVGRDQGLGSNLFGLTEQDALFDVSFPGLTPPQVAEALKEIENSAFYLRHDQGRYYASLDPSVNIALARIRRSLSTENVGGLLTGTARKVVKADIKTFHVVPDVSAPEHIPDKTGKPVLALVSLDAGIIDVDAMVTTAGLNRPRTQQNLVFLLVPEAVRIKGAAEEDASLFGEQLHPSQEALRRMEDIARTVLAMRRLRTSPHDYGINPARLDEDRFKQREAEREQALVTAVTQAYNSLWYPGASGNVTRKEIKTAGGEGGTPVIEVIRRALLEEGEIVTAEHTAQSHLADLGRLFFARSDTVSLTKLRENFCCLRPWPILESPEVLAQVIRSGVSRGAWCLFRMGDEENVKPTEFYSREVGDLPLNLDLDQLGYSLVTVQGANKRGWTASDKPDPARVEGWVREAVAGEQTATVAQIAEKVAETHGTIPEQAVANAVAGLVREGRIMTYKGKVDQEKKPELISGVNAVLYSPDSDDVVVTKAKAAEKGWVTAKTPALSLSGKEGAYKLLPLLRRIGSLYARGGKATIDSLDLCERWQLSALCLAHVKDTRCLERDHLVFILIFALLPDQDRRQYPYALFSLLDLPAELLPCPVTCYSLRPWLLRCDQQHIAKAVPIEPSQHCQVGLQLPALPVLYCLNQLLHGLVSHPPYL